MVGRILTLTVCSICREFLMFGQWHEKSVGHNLAMDSEKASIVCERRPPRQLEGPRLRVVSHLSLQRSPRSYLQGSAQENCGILALVPFRLSVAVDRAFPPFSGAHHLYGATIESQ